MESNGKKALLSVCTAIISFLLGVFTADTLETLAGIFFFIALTSIVYLFYIIFKVEFKRRRDEKRSKDKILTPEQYFHPDLVAMRMHEDRLLINRVYGNLDSNNIPCASDPNPIKCDRCLASISYKTGYAFYCTSSLNISNDSHNIEMGNMMLCDNCTDSIMTPENWNERIKEVQHGDYGSPSDGYSIQGNIDKIDIGIIALCIHLNLEPHQAKAKAKKLAELYWQDTQNGSELVYQEWNRNRS